MKLFILHFSSLPEKFLDFHADIVDDSLRGQNPRIGVDGVRREDRMNEGYFSSQV